MSSNKSSNMSSKKSFSPSPRKNLANDNQEETLIEFPCEFPIKVMGAAIPEFHDIVTKIAKSHDTDFDSNQITQNVSKTGKYVSLTLNIHAKDKPQLDAIYKDLSDNELVLWAL